MNATSNASGTIYLHVSQPNGLRTPELTANMPKGRVFIAGKKFRGPHAPTPPDATKRDVTSAQPQNSIYRKDFSPMTPCITKGYNNFEAYWQSRKRYKKDGRPVSNAKAKKIDAWWKKQTTPKRRCAIAHPRNGYTVSHAEDEEGAHYGYIESRKKLYVPQYLEMIKGREALVKCKKFRDEGKDQVFMDFDGPKDAEGKDTCVEVTVETLRQYMQDTRFPFGHGFVVAAEVAGINHALYAN